MNGYPRRRPNNMPLIILAVVAIAVVLYFVTKKKDDPFANVSVDSNAGLPPLEAPDPCKGVPDWACAATKLLNPLAQTSVDVYKIKKGVYVPPTR